MSLSRSEVYDLTAEMVALGFLAFPVVPNEKVPMVKNGFLSANGDLDRIRVWTHHAGHPNVGLVYPADALPLVFILDVDGGHGESSWQSKWKELERRLGKLPKTLITKTPSGGRHIYLVWNSERDGPPPSGNRFLGFTVRWPGAGYVLGAGSEIDGKVYETNHAPIVEVPASWAAAALEDGPAVIKVGESSSAIELPASVAEGARYDAIRTLVAGYYNREIPKDTIWTVVLHDLAPRFEVPLSEPELRERFERTWDHIAERLGPPRATPEQRAEKAAIAQRNAGFEDLILEELPTGEFPREPDPIAFAGLAGEAVSNLEHQTSASRVGLLTSILAISGAVLGVTTHFFGQQTSAFMASLVGESGRGRKGTAMNAAWDALTADSALGQQSGTRINGIGSGEGIVATAARRAEREGYAQLLIFEGELGQVLTVTRREGSTLTAVLRNAFDRQPLMNITKATGAIGVEPRQYQLGALTAITPSELRELLGATDLVNGFGSRFLWVPVVGRDGPVSGQATHLHPAVASQFAVALEDARLQRHRPYELEDDAMDTLKAYYAVLAAQAGTLGTLSIRLATIACRVALTHAALDQDRQTVSAEYVARGIALAEYSRSGLSWIFGEMLLGNPDAERLLRVLMAVGRPMQRSELGVAAWRNHWSGDRLDAGLDVLRKASLVTLTKEPMVGRGRPAQLIGLTGLEGGFSRFYPSPTRARARESNETSSSTTENTGETGENTSFERKTVRENMGENTVQISLHEGENGTGSWRWPCRAYREHQFLHRLVDGLWECSACAPGVAS